MATLIRRRPPSVAPPLPASVPPVQVKTSGPVKRRVQSVIPIKPYQHPVVDLEAREENEGGNTYTETIARYASKVTNPLTAIRAKCVECSGGSLKEVAECRVMKCALRPFRMGTNPLHKKTRDRMAREGDE